MGKKERRVWRHGFFDKLTIPGVIVLTILGFIIAQFLIGGIFGIPGIILSNGDRTTMTVFSEIGTIFGAFVLLSFFWRLFYPEYEGGLKGGRRVPFWILIGVVIAVAILIKGVLTNDFQFGVPPFVNIVAAVMAGIFEEALFRGVTASYLMRQWRGEKKILPVIFLSSAFFALTHVINIANGAPAGITIMQTIHAFVVGCFLCAMFLRSGNLLPVMIWHVLNDIFAFMDVSSFEEGGIYTEGVSVTSDVLLDLIIWAVVFLALTFILVRPSVRREICSIWEEKWKKR